MPPEIRPTRPDDLPALSRFLTGGFHAAPEAEFAAVDVLRWKYFDPRGGPESARSLVAVEEGRIVGHVGVCPTAWHGPGLPAGGIGTLHMTDWLTGRPGAGTGARLMLRSHRETPTQYALGASADARRVLGGGGYQLLATVPVFRRVVRPSRAHPIRWGRDLVRLVAHRPRRPRVALELRRVESFGAEVGPVLEAYARHAVCTGRGPELLNHLLRYPRGGIAGWRFVLKGGVVGFGLTSLVRQAGARVGKVVDCVLADLDPDLWHAALSGLVRKPQDQGADVVEAFGGTPWAARALGAAGFSARYPLDFRLRDKTRLIAPESTFHLTPLEADYAYT